MVSEHVLQAVVKVFVRQIPIRQYIRNTWPNLPNNFKILYYKFNQTQCLSLPCANLNLLRSLKHYQKVKLTINLLACIIMNFVECAHK